MFRKFLCCAILLLITACDSAPVYESTVYTPPLTPGGRLCMLQCDKSRGYCQESCGLDYRACINNVQARAQRDYDAYARDRFTNHLPVELLPSDFERDDVCTAAKKSCYDECDSPYNGCYKSCGGAVTVTTSCQFLCFK